MARLLLVTRSMALALRLADTHDVVEHPAEDLDSLAPDDDIEVVVLDVADPTTAMQVVEGLRAQGRNIPVLIVSGYQAEWAGLLSLNRPDVYVVPLPITRRSLLLGIARLTGAEAEEEIPEPSPRRRPVRAADVPSGDHPEGDHPDGDHPDGDHINGEPPDGFGPQRSAPPSQRRPDHPDTAEQPTVVAPGAEPRKFQVGRRPSQRPAASAAPAPPAANPVVEPPAPPTSPPPMRPLAPDGHPLGEDYDPFFASRPPGLESLQPTWPDREHAGADVAELVEELLERSAQLFGVTDTAQVLADEVVERADADAAAVLVPDGQVWRVSAGVGLRPLERRLVLDDTHWLIEETAIGGRALLVEDTDIVRQKLSGAPLASWRHVMTLPIGELRAAVILARGGDGGPFRERDLAAVVDPVREAAGLLERAMQIRRLARLLAPMRDADPDAARR
jgi:hypothetical protein